MSVARLAWAVVVALAMMGGLAGTTVAKQRKPAASAAVDWSKRTSVTTDGAYVLGKPAAKLRLVEYISYTCSHCADYVREAALPLKAGYVARGKAAIELRHAVRDRFDLTATLLARCGGPSRFFGNTEAILVAQPAWLARAGEYDTAATPTSIDDGVRAIAKATGLEALMRARGYTPAQIDVCLTDDAQQEAVGAMTRQSFAKIQGTPSFELNGTVLDGVHSWAALEPQLQAALAR